MQMKANSILLIVGLLGIASAVGYNLVGASIDSDGILSEPFFLVPLSYVLLLVGFGGLMLRWAIGRMRQA